jgi:seryl-tRNA synthetase
MLDLMSAEPMEIDLELLRTAPRAALDGLEADLAFCHPAIIGLEAIDPAAGTLTLNVERAEGIDPDELRRMVTEVASLSIRSYRFVKDAKPLWRNEARGAYAAPTAIEEFTSAYLCELGPGQFALVGPAAELRAALDTRFRKLAAGVDAEPWHLPNIEVTSGVVEDTGYLASHPQHVTFGYHLPPHFAEIQAFAAGVKQRGGRAPEESALRPTGFILEPVVCHNVYRALRGSDVSGGRAITALGTAYRYEGFRFRPLLRHWEFSMREVVLFGDAPYVASRRQRLLELTQELVAELDLAATIEIATDPFFVSAAGARAFQAIHSTKLELKLELDATHSTAASSFNLHGTHFAVPMTISVQAGDSSHAAETACVGFGLERWMAAIVARWGPHPSDWPL